MDWVNIAHYNLITYEFTPTLNYDRDLLKSKGLCRSETYTI